MSNLFPIVKTLSHSQCSLCFQLIWDLLREQPLSYCSRAQCRPSYSVKNWESHVRKKTCSGLAGALAVSGLIFLGVSSYP